MSEWHIWDKISLFQYFMHNQYFLASTSAARAPAKQILHVQNPHLPNRKQVFNTSQGNKYRIINVWQLPWALLGPEGMFLQLDGGFISEGKCEAQTAA